MGRKERDRDQWLGIGGENPFIPVSHTVLYN